jgi:hypothetical protein
LGDRNPGFVDKLDILPVRPFTFNLLTHEGGMRTIPGGFGSSAACSSASATPGADENGRATNQYGSGWAYADRYVADRGSRHAPNEHGWNPRS